MQLNETIHYLFAIDSNLAPFNTWIYVYITECERA